MEQNIKTCIESIKMESCTGCSVCENICPVNAISMKADREGFWYPNIDREICIRCGKCADVCPISQENTSILSDHDGETPIIYAGWSLDEGIRYHSTSGGIFSELALEVLFSGGYICGAVYDEAHEVKHAMINTRQDIARLRQSKYVQSNMGDIYRKTGNLLNKDKSVLFCGCPCHCAGLFHYCEENHIQTETLYLIDFICRGANSPKVYRKFLAELEEQYQSAVNRVWFKNKIYGWNRFSTKIEFENGLQYLKDRYHDIYIRGYIEENLYIRPSCTCCHFKGLNRIADITLADFWGVQLEERMHESDGGTSMIMLHTKKGQELWDAVQHRVYWIEKGMEDVIAGNVCFENSVEQGAHREQFMKDLDTLPVIENIERFLKNDIENEI